MANYGNYGSRVCSICGTSYTEQETEAFLSLVKLDNAPPELMQYCPKCLANIYLDILSKTKTEEKPVPTSRTKPSYKASGTTTPADFNKPFDPPLLKPFKKFLAVLFSILALGILAYSLIIKYVPDSELPNFPFFPYVLGFSFLIFFIGASKSTAIFAVLILVNFFTPHFRNLFYSYFDLTIWKVVFTLLFISSFFSLTTLFQQFYTNALLPKYRTITVKIYSFASFKALIPSLVLYFAVMSPLYMGAIEPVPDDSVTIDKIQEDPIFDALTSITNETADIEIARQYFFDGKEASSQGTIEALNRSIELYEMALVLVPEFSTAYTEIAYSYGCLYRIEKTINKKSTVADEYLNKARIALDAAYQHNPGNYTTYAVESILNYFSGNKKAAKESIEKALDLMGDAGKNERILQAMALVEKKKIQSLNYLITIQERINSNSAELHNFLALKYWEVGNLEKTKEMAERAILLNPKYDEPYFNLALVAEEKSEILERYDKVIQMQSDYADRAFRFKKILKWQSALRLIFWILFPIGLIQIIGMQSLVTQGNMKQETLGCWTMVYVLIFMILFGGFGLYVNNIYPVESLTHLFPLKFPFF